MNDDTLRLSRRWRWAGYIALAAVLGLGLWGYTDPDIILTWENLLALCGLA
ncbi:hypothetical protein [Verticiella sediminum]|uniref:hypothetical protein n=1 Tax=Verticiella sediminum TaxID=1247510 RepID=UPI001478199B|nr:hypothetical protein [Verticiella sediminum]